MRVLADIALLLSVLYLPWWVGVMAAAAFFFRFPRYYELFGAALATDVLYGAPLPQFGGFQFVHSVGAVALWFALSFIKNRMRFRA